MNEMEKLRVLLPHWIEHNRSHEAEFARWAEISRQADHEDVADLISRTIDHMRQANEELAQALDKVGGPLEGGHHHHTD